jgi:hypothetical protein
LIDIGGGRDWYTSVLGLLVEIEFVEDGTLRGLALADASGQLRLALRLAASPTGSRRWPGRPG